MEANKVVVVGPQLVFCDLPGVFCPITGDYFGQGYTKLYEIISVQGYPFIQYPQDIVIKDGILVKMSEEYSELHDLPVAMIEVVKERFLNHRQVRYLQEKAFCEVVIEEVHPLARL